MLKSNKEITQESYQATASEFANNVSQLAPLESIEKFMLLLQPHAKIVDIGCGSGRDAQIFSDNGLEVVGIDFSSKLLDIARSHAPQATFQLMDIENITLPHETFDGAWAVCSLGHISKNTFPHVLQQIRQILKHDGYFYLALKQGQGEVLETDSRYDGQHQKFWSYFEEEELKHFLQQAGFNILSFEFVEKLHSYHTHHAFRIFCQRSPA